MIPIRFHLVATGRCWRCRWPAVPRVGEVVYLVDRHGEPSLRRHIVDAVVWCPVMEQVGGAFVSAHVVDGCEVVVEVSQATGSRS